MRYVAMAAAGLGLLAMTANAGALPSTMEGAYRFDAHVPMVLAQNEPKKSETIKQKVKRVWRNMTGYKFAVACPALIPLSHSTCTETGKNRAAARAKCISQNPFCSVSDVK
jgi:hypothetical protein